MELRVDLDLFDDDESKEIFGYESFEAFMASGVLAPGSPEMVARVLISLIGELAASVADAENAQSARREVEGLIRRVLAALRAE